MRHFLFVLYFVFSSILFFSTIGQVGAQYPEYKWINPYPRDVVGNEVVCAFDFSDKNVQDGWSPLSQAELSFTGNEMKVVSSGNDPYIKSPNVREFRNQMDTTKAGQAATDSAITGPVMFRITMKSTMGEQAQIFWESDKQSGFTEDRSMRFDVSPEANFKTYTVSGTIDGNLLAFRFDPGTKEGVAEISKIEIIMQHLTPLEITNMISDNDHAEITITNHSEKAVWVSSSLKQDNRPQHNREILANQTITLRQDFPKKEPFESVVFKLFERGRGLVFQRTFHAFHEDRETGWITIGTGNLKALFAKNGSGAKIVREGKTVGVITPLAFDDNRLPPASDLNGSIELGATFGSIVEWEYARSDSGSIEYRSPQNKSARLTRRISFQVNGDEIRYGFDSEKPLFGPQFHPLGTMEQAVLSGVEYLEKGEHSSSKADIEIPEFLRYSPAPLKMTMPFAGIITDRVSFGLLWEYPRDVRPIFATPDFLEGKSGGDSLQHRLGLFGAKMRGSLRVGPGFNNEFATNAARTDKETLEHAILWAVQKRGIPEPPPVPRTLEKQRQLNLDGLMKSELYKEGGWYHAILPGGGQSFPRKNGADFASTIWQISGNLPQGSPYYERGGAHLENPVAFFLVGLTKQWLGQINAEAEHRRNIQQEDGSFRYEGMYLKGHWENTASGYCGDQTVRLFDHYRYTGDPQSLAAALKGTDFLNRYRVPRGAQVWELSLHTPDIMGSGWCCIANVRAFEATGKKEYLEQARRWAITGLPFVYQWDGVSDEETPDNGVKKRGVMLYATTPVLGATNWVAPNWIGLPVQWCGLDYAEALFLIDAYDKTLAWKAIAEGILIAGEQMQYENGPSIGLLPDSWVLKTQKANPFDINPCVLERLRRRLLGQPAELDVVVSKDAKHRIVSPFAVKWEGKTAVIDAKQGTDYQILIDGTTIRDIHSLGLDRIDLE